MTTERSRSENVFALLQQIADEKPDLRPGQIISLVMGDGDLFYHEARDWKDKLRRYVDVE